MSVTSVGFSPVSPILPQDLRFQTARHGDVQQSDVQHGDVQPAKLKSQVIQSTADDLQRISSAFNKKLQFEVDRNSNQVIVKVIDKDTDKVIRELPPEELQRLYSKLQEAVGLLFNEMV